MGNADYEVALDEYNTRIEQAAYYDGINYVLDIKDKVAI